MKKKGFAMGVSLGVTAGLLVVSLGATAVVLKTNQENSAVEGSQMSYFAAERGIEYALFDVSGHLPGYQVEKDAKDATGDTYGKLKTEGKETQTELVIESRETTETLATSITLPANKKGNATTILGETEGENWNVISEGESVQIPLYLDNTGQ